MVGQTQPSPSTEKSKDPEDEAQRLSDPAGGCNEGQGQLIEDLKSVKEQLKTGKRRK